MPAFILDLGSSEHARAFYDLSAFTRGYIECALWADGNAESLSVEGDGEDEEDAGLADVSPELMAAMSLDCLTFETANAADLEAAEEAGRDRDHLGHDFWLSRNGHGTGFWDRGLGEVGERLHAAAQACGQVDLYRGDDGLIYA